MKAAPDAPIRTSATVLDRILTTGRPTLIVFETPGCEPCEALRPALDQVACEFRHRVLVVRVTDSAEGWLAARSHLTFVPTFSSGAGARSNAASRGTPGTRPSALTWSSC